MEVLHDGSSRIYFLLEAFINILFRGAQVFFFVQSGVQFLLPYLFRWCYVILTISFVLHDSQVVRNEIVKPINFFEYELFSIHQYLRRSILVYISPIAFPKDCCYYGAYNWPKFFYPPGGISFSFPCGYQSNLSFPLVAEFHLNFEMFFISPQQAYSFRYWFSNNSVRPFS